MAPAQSPRRTDYCGAVLNTATDDEVIVRNPCRIKGAGVEATPERPVITLAQVLALAAAMPPRYRALVLLAVFASMRWGELIGLRRVDLDLESASVSIERSAVEVGKRIVIKTPKTSAGIRSVALAGVAGARAVAPPRHLRRGRAGWSGVPRSLRSHAVSTQLRHDLEAG